MTGDRQERKSPFSSAEDDRKSWEKVPVTPQTSSPAYRLAFDDPDFLLREELRPLRLQLELLKPSMILDERGVESTVVVFGGARIPEPGKKPFRAATPQIAENLEKKSIYYDQARGFARLASEESMKHYGREFVIVSGGGPGVMEAANRGAADVGAASIGLNIVLQHEQAPNEFVTPELCFQFHYFAIRKMHFLMRAKALACFPGGFGTMDELFEALTLIQTGKVEPMPIIMFGEKFWRRVVDLDALADEGTISPDDIKLMTFVDSEVEGWEVVRKWYGL